MSFLELDQVTKIFPGDVRAVDRLTLNVEEGEFLVLVGPSGCGKSTVLRMIAGLESVTEGEIRLREEAINHREPRERNVAMVFQNYALYPHMTVRQNLEFPLRMAKLNKQERGARVEQVANTLGLAAFLEQKPGNLSGGQRQRVAMGRAMVRKPDLFLLDEPLSNLDAELRMQIRTEIARLQSRLGTTTIYVTHDQVEAMTLGDRVAVLSAGKLQQIGAGQELYDHPVNTFVAGFIGTPGMNLFRSELRGQAPGEYCVTFGDLAVAVDSQKDNSALAELTGKTIVAGVRPESFSFADRNDRHRFEAEVTAVEALGHELLVYFQSPQPVVRHGSDADDQQQSEQIESSMVARLSTKEIPEPGSKISLRLASGGLRLFDEQGEAIRD